MDADEDRNFLAQQVIYLGKTVPIVKENYFLVAGKNFKDDIGYLLKSININGVAGAAG